MAPRTVGNMTGTSAATPARRGSIGRNTLVRIVAAAVVLVGGSAVVVGVDAPSAEACDEVTIPSLDLSRCVVPGDQPEIDAGHVVRVDYLSSTDVHWLAGHRTSHGATFRTLTDLRIGATVRYRGQVYVVIDYRLVDRFRPDEVMPWTSSATPSVVLQTSHVGNFVHVWRTIAVTPVVPMVATAAPPVPLRSP
jgi:hypothetical protein